MKTIFIVMVFFFGCLTAGAKVLNCRINQGVNMYSDNFFIKLYLNSNAETIISALPAAPVPPQQINCASSNRLVRWIVSNDVCQYKIVRRRVVLNTEQMASYSNPIYVDGIM